jgi:hypothetical protein
MMLTNNKNFGLIIILILFIFSVYIRFPYLNRPLGDRHEWITAHSLITIENYFNYPVSTHLFRLINTYPLPANYNITDWNITRLVDQNGIGYYTTYPPFSTIFAYSIFTLLGVHPNVLSIQILNLSLHGITSIFVFLTIYHAARFRKVIAALFATTLYIFTSINLWFFSATYSWDILWHYLAILNIYVVTLLIYQKFKPANLKKYLLLIAIINSLTIYTELQGLFFALALFLVYYWLKLPQLRYFSRLMIISTITPIILLLIQYGTINSPRTFLEIMIRKFFIEYGTFGLMSDLWFYFWVNYQILLTPILSLLTYSLVFLWLCNRDKYFSKSQIAIVLLMAIPTILHFLTMFPDVVKHEFAGLKLVVTLIMFIGFTVSNLELRAHKWNYPLTLLAAISLWLYVSQSIVDFRWFAGDKPYLAYSNLANHVSQTLQKDEALLFITNRVISPQVSYYLKRNYATFTTYQAALAFIEARQLTKSRLVEVDPQLNIIQQSVFP